MAKELRTGQCVCVEGKEGTVNLNNLSKSDYVNLWEKLKPCGITLDELVTQFLHDLLKDEHSSDYRYRAHISDWFYSVFEFYALPYESFESYLENHCLHMEEFVKYYPAFFLYYKYGMISDQRYLYPDDPEVNLNDSEYVSGLLDLFGSYVECVKEFSDDVKGLYNNPDSADIPMKLIEKEVMWYRKRQICLDNAIDDDELPF